MRPLLLMGLLLALPAQVMAQDFTYQGVVYTVLDDEAKTCGTRAGSADNPGNDFMDEVLDIPATVSDGTDTYTVTEIGAYSFADNYFIESIILPSTVRTIGDYAFNGNSVLETIDMAEGLETINAYAFTDCPSLKSFHIPNSVTYVGKQVCANCRNLATLTIGNSVERIGDEAFMNCVKIESVDIPASMIFLGPRAFTGCSALRKVIVYPVAEGAEINGFEDLKISAPGIETASTIEHVVCPDYATFNFPTAELRDYRTIFYPLGTRGENNLFRTDDTLYAVAYSPENGILDIPEGIKYIAPRAAAKLSGSAYFVHVLINELRIPDSLIEIGEMAFWECGIKKLVIGENSQLETIKPNAFHSSQLDYFKLPPKLTQFEGTGISAYELDLGDLTYIPDGSFDCFGPELNLPDNVTYIGAGCFYSYQADMMVIPSSVQTLWTNAFESVKYIVVPPTLKELYVVDVDPYRSVKYVTPDGVDIDFEGDLTKFRESDYVIHYPAKGTVIEDGWVWSANHKILYSVPVVTGEKLIIPGTAQTIDSKALAGCEADEIIIEDGVRTIREKAFVKTTFSKIRLPETLTNIEEGAFGLDGSREPICNHLTHLAIPGSLESVPNLLIQECDTMTINEGVKEIHYDNFNRTCCTVITATTPPSINLAGISLTDFNPRVRKDGIGYFTPFLVVPPSMQSYYQNDPAWSKLDVRPNCSFNLPDTIYAKTVGKHSLGLSSLYPLSDYADQLEITLTRMDGTTQDLQQYFERDGDEYFIVVNQKMWEYYTPSSPCEFTYTLEMKMGDFYSETKRVIVKLTPSEANGDSNLDGAVTVSDAINTANYAVGNKMEFFNITAADMNEDGLITIGDASRIITAILNQPLDSLQAQRGANIKAQQNGDCLGIAPFSLQAGQTGAIEVALKNSCDYVALQADVYAPAGMTIVGVEKGKRSQTSHSLMHSACDAAAVRVALFNFSNNTFAASDEAVLRLIVKAEEAYTPGSLTIANIIASDSAAKEYYLPAAVSHDDSFSGVETIPGTEAQAHIAVEGRELVVSQAAGKTVRIYSAAGVAVAEFTAASDCERQPLAPGFYIVAAGNAVEKVIIK